MPVEPLVHIVDDNESMRTLLKEMFGGSGYEVACHASAEAFLAAYEPDRPGCIVLDQKMEGMSGLDLIHKLRAGDDPIAIVFLSGVGNVDLAVEAMKLGAVEFLQKPVGMDVLLDRVAEAIRKDAQIRQQRRERDDMRRRLDDLTPREREVLDLLTRGKSGPEIAAQLDISEKTLAHHRSSIVQKVGVSTPAELVRVAILARLSS